MCRCGIWGCCHQATNRGLGRRGRQLGDVVNGGDTVVGVYQLSNAGVTDLLSRHPEVAQMVSNAIENAPWLLTQGISFTDEVFGNVLINADANGIIHYQGHSPIDPNVVNRPVYTSPSGPPLPTCFDSLEAFAGCASGWLGTAAVGASIYLFYRLKK